MDLNARVDVNCGRKDRRTDGLTDGRTENWTPISHLAKTGATKIWLKADHGEKQSVHSCTRHSVQTCSIILESIKIFQMVPVRDISQEEVKILIRGHNKKIKPSRLVILACGTPH